jgi:TolB-like protein/class 3 adenylate cyclase
VAREQRRLAAILAADVVGYSRLMGRDEAGTLARLRDHRKQRFEPTLARHGGRLVKLTGDGALAEFPSAVDALSAAIEFQQAMVEANQGQPQEHAIVFRIGLHLGDLIVEGDDLYGDGVNIAARLEAEAPAGGIVISRTVHEAGEGRLKARFEDLGDLALKNIERPVRAFRVDWAATDWAFIAPAVAQSVPAAVAGDMPLALPDKPSIAVLPFQNMSGDPEQEYFADGVAEDILTGLSRFRSLFVIARNSSFTYKGKAIDVRTVSHELGVRYVLEGSVRKAANRLRITVQLIQADTGAHIWAERYDGELTDIFELQDRITAEIVGAIAPKLEQAEIERAYRKPTESLGAYDCYLRGMACFNLWTKEGFEEARQFWYRAIELDPGFAAAHAMASACFIHLMGRGLTQDQSQVAEASRLARRALDLDRDDAVVLAMAGAAIAHVARELDAGAGFIGRALVVNPNLGVAWLYSGWVNVWLGLPAVAIDHFARAMRLSPLDPNTILLRVGIAHAHFMLGSYDEAAVWANKALQEQPTSMALRMAAASAALAGRQEEARRFCQRLQILDPGRRVSTLFDTTGPYQRHADRERYQQGLRLAGMPE